MKIYGIPNCGSVKKALDFMRSSGFEFEFVDFKKQKPSSVEVEKWANAVGMDRLFNTKGTKYKSSGLDYKTMSEADKKIALASEPTMIKRPVIEYNGKIVVGFDEELYKKEFAK